MGTRFRWVALPTACGLLVTSCLSTNLPPIGSTGTFSPERDESQLWQALREAEGKVLPPRAVYEDLALEQYLTDLARRVTPGSYAAAGGQAIQVKSERIHA
jgi:hypothetical protein